MKINRHGQGAIITDGDYAKIRKQLSSARYRLLLDIARYTGERWGALLQIQVADVWDSASKVRSHITFRAAARKAAPGGLRETRQVPVHPTLKEILTFYPVPNSKFLFKSKTASDQPITLRAADLAFRAAVARAGLQHKGYCTHSTRRTFITRLYERGVDLKTIQAITGHHDLKALIRYIEHDPARSERAIALL